MIVLVRDGNLDQANRILKKRMQKSKIYEEIKNKKHHVSGSEKKALRISEKTKKIQKYLKKRMQKEGF